MFNYEKRLEYPIHIKETNPKLAKAIITQYGGPNGELGASMRYLSQRYTMPYKECAALLTDIGTEELGHFEMIATIVHQLTRSMTMEELKASGFDDYYVDHTLALWPQAASGTPFTAAMFQSVGDPIADLNEDMAAEQKARLTYDNILRLCADSPDVADAIRFLRAREIVHFQRFGEANREDCSKIPKARKAHKFSTFGKSLSIRTFAGHRHEPPYLLLYLKMKMIHEIGRAVFLTTEYRTVKAAFLTSTPEEQERRFFYALMLRSRGSKSLDTSGFAGAFLTR